MKVKADDEKVIGFEVEESLEDNVIVNPPKTNDNIMMIILIFVISSIMLGVIYKKKINVNS